MMFEWCVVIMKCSMNERDEWCHLSEGEEDRLELRTKSADRFVSSGDTRVTDDDEVVK